MLSNVVICQDQQLEIPKGQFIDAREVTASDQFTDEFSFRLPDVSGVRIHDDVHIEKGQFIPAPQITRARKMTSTKSPVILFHEDFESGVSGWSMTGSWDVGGRTTGPINGYNSGNCAATNLHGKYSNNANDWLISPIISLGTADMLRLDFYEWFDLESGYDYGRVHISTDNGNSWTVLATSNGSSNWRETQVSLTPYQNNDIRIAFQLTTDGSVVGSGWYIDDIRIVEKETLPLTANMTSINSQSFPFIYMNIAVNYMGVGVPELTHNDFTVYEDGVLQTDYFQVTPPAEGGGARLVDIIFIMDNSGSMSDEINAVTNNVEDFVNNLAVSGVDFALGLTRYGQDANGGNPIIEDNGILTSDINYFKNDVWQRNVIDGWYEPGYYAITQSASGFNFRPGAQKVFIIITDETPNQGTDETLAGALQVCVDNSITLFALTLPNLFWTFEPITDATNGACFDIYSDFDDILDYISNLVANTYLVRYRSNNPVFDGIIRYVEVPVTYLGEVATATGSYLPGASPVIERTQATKDLHNQAWAEFTEFLIEVEITDNVPPYTQNATLFYKKTTATQYQSTAMVQSSKGEIWSASIPASVVETPGIDYYITATDGQTTASDPPVNPDINPYQLAILPNEAPVIIHVPVTTLTVNVPINITAVVTDNTNYLEHVRLYYRQTGQLIYQMAEMVNTQGDNFSAVIPATWVTANGVDYYIRATDNFSVSSYHGTAASPHRIEVPTFQPPTNLIANLNEETGQVQLDWNFTTAEGFFEDFSDGVADNWIPVTGNWSVPANTYNVSSSSDYLVNTSYYNQDFSNFEVEVKMRKTSGGSCGLGVLFNGNPDNLTSIGDWINYYHFYYCAESASWNISCRTSESNWYFIQEWVESPDLNTGIGAWNVLRVVFADGYMDVYFNGVLQGSYYDSTFSSGKIGLKMFDNNYAGNAEYDYVSVMPLSKGYTFGKVDHNPFRTIYEGEGPSCYDCNEKRNIVATEIAPAPAYGPLYTYQENNEKHTFMNFRVYRDGVLRGNPTETTYTDLLPGDGSYQYTVTAVYDEGESVPAGPVTVNYFPLCEAVDNCDLVFTTGGNKNWFRQTAVTYDGVDAAQSGNITHNQQSWLETTVEGPGFLSFWWKVSSENNYDFLNFYINGVRQDRISGNVDWNLKEYSIGEGTHTIRWAYTKDGSVSHGQDCGWVDQVVYITGDGDCMPPNWTPADNLEFNMQLIGHIIIDDAVSTNPNHMVGAFVDGECRGVASPLPDADGLVYLTIHSTVNHGETIELVIWDSEACETCTIDETIHFQHLNQVGNPANPFPIECFDGILNLDFQHGYTWFSVNIDPGSMHINDLFTDLSPCQHDRIIGQSSFATFYGSNWIGSLTHINPDKMYVMELCNNQSIMLSGDPVEIQPISLNNGFTWIGYHPQGCLPVNAALANISPSPVTNNRVIGQTAFASYHTNQWTGSLTEMCPGKGYMIDMSNTATLIYPGTSAKNNFVPEKPDDSQSPTGDYPLSNLQNSMTLIANLVYDNGSISMNEANVVYAYVDDECRGMASPVAKYNGAMFMSIGSNVQVGELVTFKVWIDEYQELFTVSENVAFEAFNAIGNMDAPFTLTMDGVVSTEDPEHHSLFIGEPYPNPFGMHTDIPYITYGLSKVSLTVYNAIGQTVYSTVKNHEQPGSYYVRIDRAQLPQGIYHFRMNVQNEDAQLVKTGNLIIR